MDVIEVIPDRLDSTSTLSNPPNIARTQLKMPYVKVSSNVARASVDMDVVLKAVSKSLSDALDRPEPFVCVEVELDKDMMFAASTEVRCTPI
jgi:hypothetical protein